MSDHPKEYDWELQAEYQESTMDKLMKYGFVTFFVIPGIVMILYTGYQIFFN